MIAVTVLAYNLAEFAKELILRHRSAEHAKSALCCSLLSFGRCGSGAVRKSNNIESLLVCSSHGTFHTAVGEKTSQGDSFDAMLQQ